MAATSSSVSGRGINTSPFTFKHRPSNQASPSTCWMGSPSFNRSAKTARRSSCDSVQRMSWTMRVPLVSPDTWSSNQRAMPERSDSSTRPSLECSHGDTTESTLEVGQGPCPRRCTEVMPALRSLRAPATRQSPCSWPAPRCARRIDATTCSRLARGGAYPWGRGKTSPHPNGLR